MITVGERPSPTVAVDEKLSVGNFGNFENFGNFVGNS
jgi:hypothetical protein